MVAHVVRSCHWRLDRLPFWVVVNIYFAAIAGAFLAAHLVADVGAQSLMLRSSAAAFGFTACYLIAMTVTSLSASNLFVLLLVISVCQGVIVSMGFTQALRANDSLRGMASGLAGSTVAIAIAVFARMGASLFDEGAYYPLGLILACYLSALLIASTVLRRNAAPLSDV